MGTKKQATKPKPQAPTPKAAETTAVSRQVLPEGGTLVLVQDQPPEHIKSGTNRGNENVQSDDLVIPRLEIVQALSPCLQASSGDYNPHAKIGMLTNSASNELYGKEVFVVPVSFTKQWLVWKKKSAGGGFFGSYPDPEKAEEKAKAEGGAAKDIEVIDTPVHLCLLVNRDKGTVDEIMIPLPRTKAKISRQWNSMIRMAGGDRFSRVYRITTNHEKNAKGEFENFAIAQSGFPVKPLYDRAVKLYEQIKAGTRNVVMDVKGFDAGEHSDTPESERTDM